MKSIAKLGGLSLWLLAVLALALPANPVRSAPLQARAQGLELVGHHNLNGGLQGDIWVHGQFAYLGTASCGTGVNVVDVSNPARPQRLGSLVSSGGSDYEVVDAVGNRTERTYDPASNLTSESSFGPTGGPSPGDNRGTNNVLQDTVQI